MSYIKRSIYIDMKSSIVLNLMHQPVCIFQDNINYMKIGPPSGFETREN